MARLLVLVPGIHLKAEKWNPLIDRLKQDPFWRADTIVRSWDHGTWVLGRRPLREIAASLALYIHGQWTIAATTQAPFDEVVLVGHSLGALLVRQAYLVGLGSNVKGLQKQPWADQVSRIVLLAGLNSGVTLAWYQKLILPLVVSSTGTLRDMLAGSDFITDLRIWWLRKLPGLAKRPVMVQVLGKNDELVGSEDSLDIEGFLEGHQFVISNATHGGLILPNRDGVFRPDQYETLSLAILRPIRNEASSEVKYDDSQKVFFIVHGIRDSNNDWVADVKRLILDQFPAATVLEPDIGRFSALQFLIGAQRRRYVRWFQKVYSRELAKNPLAHFNFVGHSYGTYLLGHGLRRLSGMQFDRVYLGGSVLPETWVWDDHRSQVGQLRNACATRDIPVGVLCSALRGLRMKDIGTAGSSGFRLAFSPESELHFYAGGHGASVSPGARPDIIGFLADGFTYRSGGQLASQSPRFSQLSAAARILLPFALVLYCAGLLVCALYSPLRGALFPMILSFAAVAALLLTVLAFL